MAGHFHLHAGVVSRSKGHSAVAAAAYQAGQSLEHAQQHQTSIDLEHRKQLNKGTITDALRAELQQHNIALTQAAVATKQGRREWQISDGDKHYTIREYEKKVKDPETGKRVTAERRLDVYKDRTHSYATREDVKATWVQAPADAPEWLRALQSKGLGITGGDRERLWNAAEAAEVARDGRPARRVEIALSRALSHRTNGALVRAYVREQFTEKGLVVDVAIHEKTASDGEPNLHAHLLISAREVSQAGTFASKKNPYWDKDERVHEWRAAWADKINSALEAAGRSEQRVDHRSYARQGSKQIPQQHLGPAAYLEQRGVETQQGNANRVIKQTNLTRAFTAIQQERSTLTNGATDRSPEQEQTPEQSPQASQVRAFLLVTKERTKRWFGAYINQRIERSKWRNAALGHGQSERADGDNRSTKQAPALGYWQRRTQAQIITDDRTPSDTVQRGRKRDEGPTRDER